MKEIDKLSKIKEQSQEIGFFLDWLSSQNIVLCTRHEHDEGCKDENGDSWCGYNEGTYVNTMIPTEILLAKYFNIDLEKVEKEKQEILKKLNKTTHNKGCR